tara:strand:+ start:94 stop:303 length:210 start_codon:yes stop_codon:yes gene_type:complete
MSKEQDNQNENKALHIADVMRSYLISEIEECKKCKARYGWIHKQFKYSYEGRINALENTLLLLETEYYA